MIFTEQIFYYFLLGFGVGLLNWFIAGWKLRDKLCWFLLGFFFNLPSLLILFFLPPLQDNSYKLPEDDEDLIITKQHRESKIKQKCLYGFYLLISILLIYLLFCLLHKFIC